jgi:hypothetical protein
MARLWAREHNPESSIKKGSLGDKSKTANSIPSDGTFRCDRQNDGCAESTVLEHFSSGNVVNLLFTLDSPKVPFRICLLDENGFLELGASFELDLRKSRPMASDPIHHLSMPQQCGFPLACE